ncbi:MAG TPA: Holliday junction resolvase RecU [Erysipelotrichaceae bacterium]|nr:Holliday junction resolvase RecU [Erysipelotrichaceae bacterium]
MKYPNGKKYIKNQKDDTEEKGNVRSLLNAANRGMSLEEDINVSNEYYKNKGIALINKRPTPINIVKVNYNQGARITDAYFERQSTTDYNGVYRGRYIDFEAKNTKSSTSFPLSNIGKHQIEHLKNVLKQDGIAFFIICFQTKNEIYLLDASLVIEYYEHGKRKSIPYEVFKEKGVLIKQDYLPRLHYIDAVNALYFK